VNFYDETQWADRIADPAAKVYDNGGLILAKGDMAYNDYLPKLTDNTDVTKIPRPGVHKLVYTFFRKERELPI